MTEHLDLPTCASPGCTDLVDPRRARLFPPGKAICLSCGDVRATQLSRQRSKSVCEMHRSNLVLVTSAQSAREIGQMRRGTGGE